MDLSNIPELLAELVEVSWLVFMSDTSDRRDVLELVGEGVGA